MISLCHNTRPAETSPHGSGAFKTCFAQYTTKEVLPFLKEFWELSKLHQDSLVPCTWQMLICHQTTNIYNSLVGHMGIPAIEHGFWTSKLTMSVESDDAKKSKRSKSSNSSKSATEINFLGRMISQKCLSTLVGIGKARLRKAMDAIPDARYGKTKSGHLRTAASVHAWLAIQYSQIAETLPDRPWGKLFCCGLWMFPLRKPCSMFLFVKLPPRPCLYVCLPVYICIYAWMCLRAYV